MGMGPTVTVGYVDDEGNWKPVTASAGLPVSGAGGGTELESYEQVSSLPDYPTEFPPSGHTHAAGDVTSGTFAVARIPSIPTSKVTDLDSALQGFVDMLNGLAPVANSGSYTDLVDTPEIPGPQEPVSWVPDADPTDLSTVAASIDAVRDALVTLGLMNGEPA